MTQKDDGGPAFPMPLQRPLIEPNPGMSLRDYFAGQAITGFMVLRATGNLRLEGKEIGENEVMATLARGAYELADALLKERAK